MIANIKLLSKNYGKLHPKMKDAYKELSAELILLNKKVPDLEDVIKREHRVVSQEEISKLESKLENINSKLKQLNYEKSNLEAKLGDYNIINKGNSLFGIVLKSLLLSISLLILLNFINFLRFKSKRVYTNSLELAGEFSKMEVFNFPKLKILKRKIAPFFAPITKSKSIGKFFCFNNKN